MSDRPVSDRPVSDRPVSERRVSERPVSERPVSERRGAVGERGFTILEVLVSVGILTMMMGIVWGVNRETALTKKRLEATQQRWREVRAATQRIVGDFGMAFLSGNENPNLTERQTFFVGEAGSTIATARFTTLGHQVLWADAHEGDQTVIAYSEESDPEDRSKKNLMRRETHRTAQKKMAEIPGDSEVLFSGIKRFELEYWDAKDQAWDEDWDTTSAAGKKGRLPGRVKITLVFDDERGKESRVTTQAQVHLQEMLQFFTN